MQKDERARDMQYEIQPCRAIWTNIGSWEWSRVNKVRVRDEPIRDETSFWVCDILGWVGRCFAKVQSSTAEAANCRISELRS